MAANYPYSTSRHVSAFRMCCVAILFLFAQRSNAQTDEDIHRLLRLVQAGKTNEAASRLESFVKQNPKHAGVLFLQGLMSTDAEKAALYYKDVAENHPRSEWADDALHRLEQYSYAVGAYNTAEKYRKQILSRYPESPFAAESRPEARKTEPEARKTEPERANKDGYALEIGPFPNRTLADKQLSTLKKAGYSVELYEKPKGKKKVYVLWLGSFPKVASAQSMAKKLKTQQNLASTVVPR